jgi:hypothetical protein
MSYSTLNSAASRFTLFGNGSDGNVTASVDVSLTRDMYYDNLTINSGAIVYTNNYRVFVKNTLTLNNGGFRCITGSNASGATAGALPPTNFYRGGTAATNGVAGAASGPASTAVQGIGVQGGQGGSNGGIRVGGTVGGVTAETVISGGIQFIRSVIGLMNGRSVKTISIGGYGLSGPQQLGSGATGGGASALSTSGGGGGGGGWVVVIARLIVDGGGGGTIYARGGTGGNAPSGTAGGGGGGSGGICGIVTNTNPIPAGVLYDANGGVGGTAGPGGGTAGSTGSAGRVVVFYD